MTKQNQLAALTALMILISGFGCASSYHRYSDCRGVNCRYCEPAPLSYPHYPGCGCHSKPGDRYLSTPALQPSSESRVDQVTPSSVAIDQDAVESEPDKPISPVGGESTIDISQRPYDE